MAGCWGKLQKEPNMFLLSSQKTPSLVMDSQLGESHEGWNPDQQADCGFPWASKYEKTYSPPKN